MNYRVLLVILFIVSLIAGSYALEPAKYPADELTSAYLSEPLWVEPQRNMMKSLPTILIFFIMIGLFLVKHMTRHAMTTRRISLFFLYGILFVPFSAIFYTLDIKIIANSLGLIAALSFLFIFLDIVIDMARAAFS